jgi:hypothetical protein
MDRILRAVLAKEGQSVADKAGIVGGICRSVGASGPSGAAGVGLALIQVALEGAVAPPELALACLRAAAEACPALAQPWLTHPPARDLLLAVVRGGVDVTADPRAALALAVALGVLRGGGGPVGAGGADSQDALWAFVGHAVPFLVGPAVTMDAIRDVCCLLACPAGLAALQRLPVAAQANAVVLWLAVVPVPVPVPVPEPAPPPHPSAAAHTQDVRHVLQTLLEVLWWVPRGCRPGLGAVAWCLHAPRPASSLWSFSSPPPPPPFRPLGRRWRPQE